jgi:hypothetical protein
MMGYRKMATEMMGMSDAIPEELTTAVLIRTEPVAKGVVLLRVGYIVPPLLSAPPSAKELVPVTE